MNKIGRPRKKRFLCLPSQMAVNIDHVIAVIDISKMSEAPYSAMRKEGHSTCLQLTNERTWYVQTPYEKVMDMLKAACGD